MSCATGMSNCWIREGSAKTRIVSFEQPRLKQTKGRAIDIARKSVENKERRQQGKPTRLLKRS